MRFLSFILLSFLLSLSTRAEKTDTCKISVERTANGFKISAASKNVFVRQGNKLDPKNYVFLTDTLVEILCKDSNVINLQDYHQEGKVTCWFQKPNEPVKQDKPAGKKIYRKLAPVERRHWLKFNSMDASTQVEMVISTDDGKSTKIDFRKCGGWSIDQVGVMYVVKKDKGDSEIALTWQNELNMFSTIELKDGEKIDEQTLYMKSPRTMQVNKILLDNKLSVPYTISTNQSDSILTDDIMLNSEISVDLSNVELSSGGSHQLIFVCSVLKNQGPEYVNIIIPIEVKEEGIWLAWIKWGLISFFGLIPLFFISIIILKRIRGSKNKRKNARFYNDRDHRPINGYPIVKKEQEKESSRIVPSNEVMKEIRKKTILTIIDEWNTHHPENMVDNSQFNINSFMNIIAKGYISPKGKAMLKKYADAYQIQDEELGAKTIEGLHTAIYNRGLLDGAASTKTTNGNFDQRSEIMNKQIRELSDQKTKLEKDFSDLKKDYASIKGEKDKLQEHVNIINKENEVLYDNLKIQEKKIAELQKLVDAQSQEHVNLLEKTIADLNKEIEIAQETITKKNSAIADEKDNVKKLTIQKEIFEAQLKDKDDEIAKKLPVHELSLNDQKEEEYQKALEKLKKDQEEKIAKLNATIKELGASANVGRDETIAKAEELIGYISNDLSQLEHAVKAVKNPSLVIGRYLQALVTKIDKMKKRFDIYKEEEWTIVSKTITDVIADIQDLCLMEMGRTGWINDVARLMSYSRLPKLEDGVDVTRLMEDNGISPVLVERVYANMVTLLGMVNLGILVPAVLANNFDKMDYDYKNSDIWIDQFFPNINIRHYKGKVLDIVQVGYTLDGRMERKPIVQSF